MAAGVEMIELDVLRPRSEFRDGDWRRAAAGSVAAGAPPSLVAHDWGDAAAASRSPSARCSTPSPGRPSTGWRSTAT